MGSRKAVLLCAFVIFAATVTSEYCQAPTKLRKQYFVYNNSSLTFMEAWRECQHLGQRLATVASCQDSVLIEEAVLKSSNPQGPWFIAGTDEGREGSFVWITTNEPIGFQNFYDNQPDNAGGIENCLEIGRWGGVKWNDVPCGWKQRFICESFV